MMSHIQLRREEYLIMTPQCLCVCVLEGGNKLLSYSGFTTLRYFPNIMQHYFHIEQDISGPKVYS